MSASRLFGTRSLPMPASRLLWPDTNSSVMFSRIAGLPDYGLADCGLLLTLRLAGGTPPARTPRKAPLVRPPAGFVVTIGLGAEEDAEPPRRSLVRWNLEVFSASERRLRITDCARIAYCRRSR
eukprot:15195162-Alexandrium_andersonii.AAC.1